MTIRFGINPIGWTNDCMHWLGDFIPVETCLAEARAAGFSGIELGRKMPKQGGELRALLDRHGLRLVGGWYSGKLLQRDAKAEIAALKEHLALHQACGAEIMVFAETSGDIVNDVGGRRSTRPQIDGAATWKTLGARTSEVADYLADQGVRMAFHHHMGTVVESAEDVRRLMENTRPSVGLLLDTGHLTYGGGDPVAAIGAFGARINHVHCKDIRATALAKPRGQVAMPASSRRSCPASSRRRETASSTITVGLQGPERSRIIAAGSSKRPSRTRRRPTRSPTRGWASPT